MEGIDIEDIGDDIEESAFEVCDYVLILVYELEAVFAPAVEELAIDVIDNLFEAVLEGFGGGVSEDAVLEVVAYAEEDAFRGGVCEVVLGGFDAFWEVFRLVGEVVAHVGHGEGPEEFGEVIPLEEVWVIVVFVVTGGSIDLEVELYEASTGGISCSGTEIFFDFLGSDIDFSIFPCASFTIRWARKSLRGPLTGRDGSPHFVPAGSSASVLMGYLLVENDDVTIYNDRVFGPVALADYTPVFRLMGFIIVGHNVNYIAVAAVEQGVGVTDGLDVGE